jgi:hypothetical protein
MEGASLGDDDQLDGVPQAPASRVRPGRCVVPGEGAIPNGMAPFRVAGHRAAIQGPSTGRAGYGIICEKCVLAPQHCSYHSTRVGEKSGGNTARHRGPVHDLPGYLRGAIGVDPAPIEGRRGVTSSTSIGQSTHGPRRNGQGGACIALSLHRKCWRAGVANVSKAGSLASP